MCSISGIVSKTKKNFINDMMSEQAHRAPDDLGKFVDNNISLGMGRLKIIDLESKNLCPMISDDYVLTYNGEIYNYKELKKELRIEH